MEDVHNNLFDSFDVDFIFTFDVVGEYDLELAPKLFPECFS
jgi:hypothetical protein